MTAPWWKDKMESISENVKRVLERVDAAARRAGAEKVTLVAASKQNDAARVREAFDAGVRAFGENRVQEMEDKLSAHAFEGAKLHFIGHLQRNKVKNVAGRVDLIESVDSPELIALIGRRAIERGTVQDILLEVNIGGEAAKSGVTPEETDTLAAIAGGTPGIRVLGLMAIPPAGAPRQETLGYFRQMYNLFVDMRDKKYDNVDMRILSMGMSADFEDAILCGANMVRVGSAIFGKRFYPVK